MTSNATAAHTHHFKLVLLGDTAVGKSCLVVRFVRDEFFEFQEPTIGGASLDSCCCVRCNCIAHRRLLCSRFFDPVGAAGRRDGQVRNLVSPGGAASLQ